MQPRHHATHLMVGLVCVSVLLAGCSPSGRQGVGELSAQAVALLETLDVDPQEGDTFDVSEQHVKLDDPYVAAGGIRETVGPQETLVALVAVLEDDGFDVVKNETVTYSLGHEVLATDGQSVIRSFVGSGSERFATYPPLEAGTYVAVTVANVRSGPAWTDIER